MINLAKQYLKRIWGLEGRIKRDTERLESLRAAADGVKAITYDGDRVQTSPADTMCERISKLVDLEKKLESEIILLEQTKTEILSTIHSLEDEQAEQVLYLRYLHHKNLYEISDTMGYTLRQLHRIHSRALNKLNKTLMHD